MGDAWTIAKAQAALGEAAYLLRMVGELLGMVYRGLPRPPDLDDRLEGRLPYDVMTDILGTLECVMDEDLPQMIHRLDRSSRITDEELAEDFRRWRKRYEGF